MTHKNLIQVEIKDIENKLDLTLKRNNKSLGLDTATKTGYAILITGMKYLSIDVGVIDAHVKNKQFKFNMLIDYLEKLVKSEYTVIIEKAFLGRFRVGNKWVYNVTTYELLTQIGAFAYAISHQKGCKNIKIITASSARKTLGFKGNSKKPELIKLINKLFGTEIKTHDIADAIILALNGLVKS